MSDSLRPCGLQYRPCPSLSPRVHSDSCLLRRWCHPTISSSVEPFSSFLQSIPASIRVFSNEVTLCIRWLKYWNFSFSISPPVNIQGWFPLGFIALRYKSNILNLWISPGVHGKMDIATNSWQVFPWSDQNLTFFYIVKMAFYFYCLKTFLVRGPCSYTPKRIFSFPPRLFPFTFSWIWIPVLFSGNFLCPPITLVYRFASEMKYCSDLFNSPDFLQSWKFSTTAGV